MLWVIEQVQSKAQARKETSDTGAADEKGREPRLKLD